MPSDGSNASQKPSPAATNGTPAASAAPAKQPEKRPAQQGEKKKAEKKPKAEKAPKQGRVNTIALHVIYHSVQAGILRKRPF